MCVCECECVLSMPQSNRAGLMDKRIVKMEIHQIQPKQVKTQSNEL